MKATRRYDIKRWAVNLLDVLNDKFPDVRPRNHDIWDPDIDLKEVDPKIVVEYAKYKLTHFPARLLETTMQYAEVRTLLCALKIVTTAEADAAEI